MNQTIRNIQLTAVLIVLISTVVAFFLEMSDMYMNRDITLADLLLMFIYIEVIGLVRSYWETRAVRITYPLVIAITALARFIICLLYTSPSPRDRTRYRMPSSA